jgi:hypothetical protein
VRKLFLSKGLVTEEFASTLLCWKKSGFSVDNTVRRNGDDHKTRVALAQYIARAPISLQKLSSMPSQRTVRDTSDFNPAIGDTIKIWDVRDFIAAATVCIPPQGVRLIRYFGLYASRSRWKWPQWYHVVRYAPAGWRETHGVQGDDSRPQPPPCTVPESACRSAPWSTAVSPETARDWARLIAKIYEVDPLVCPRCFSKMRVLAVITNPAEVKKILRHLIKIACPPPGLDPAAFN